MERSQINFFYLNIGHFLDHLFMLVFATAAALRLITEWDITYAALIPYATPGFIAFGVCAIPAGWLADKWSKPGMMVVFFVGIGVSSILAGLADSPLQIAFSLTLVGVFAAIYHPVGLAMVVENRRETGMALAVNGVFGNMGVAVAALLTGYLIDVSGWRSAFWVPGIVSVLIGMGYWWFVRSTPLREEVIEARHAPAQSTTSSSLTKEILIRLCVIIFFTTAVGSLVFQSTTFALPKIFAERLTDLADSATLIGWYAFLAFSAAALAQLVVGFLVDRYSLRTVFICVAISQAAFFFLMINLDGLASLIVAVAFLLAVFGQIPINDVLVGRIAKSEWRARAFALRYIVSFTVAASTLPFIAWLHSSWGFEALFQVLAIAALAIFVAVLCLPKANGNIVRG